MIPRTRARALTHARMHICTSARAPTPVARARCTLTPKDSHSACTEAHTSTQARPKAPLHTHAHEHWHTRTGATGPSHAQLGLLRASPGRGAGCPRVGGSGGTGGKRASAGRWRLVRAQRPTVARTRLTVSVMRIPPRRAAPRRAGTRFRSPRPAPPTPRGRTTPTSLPAHARGGTRSRAGREAAART